MRPAQLQAEFGVAPSTLRGWDTDGIFPADQRTPGGHRRWRETRVREFLAGLRTAA